MFMRKLFGPIYRNARLKAQQTQIEFALILGKSQSYVSKLEKGILEPTALEWFEFCRKYKLSPSCLLRSVKKKMKSVTSLSNAGLSTAGCWHLFRCRLAFTQNVEVTPIWFKRHLTIFRKFFPK